MCARQPGKFVENLAESAHADAQVPLAGQQMSACPGEVIGQPGTVGEGDHPVLVALPDRDGRAGALPAAPQRESPVPDEGQVIVPPAPPRIVANPLDNALIIQADAQQYQNILKILKDLDVPPRQILLEAKIYEVDLSDDFASGIQYKFQQQSGAYRKPVASLLGGTGVFSVGTLVDNGRELLAMLSLNENASHAHMVSEPSLIATDSIPASINVGTQVPVSTGQTTPEAQPISSVRALDMAGVDKPNKCAMADNRAGCNCG